MRWNELSRVRRVLTCEEVRYHTWIRTLYMLKNFVLCWSFVVCRYIMNRVSVGRTSNPLSCWIHRSTLYYTRLAVIGPTHLHRCNTHSNTCVSTYFFNRWFTRNVRSRQGIRTCRQQAGAMSVYVMQKCIYSVTEILGIRSVGLNICFNRCSTWLNIQPSFVKATAKNKLIQWNKDSYQQGYQFITPCQNKCYHGYWH